MSAQPRDSHTLRLPASAVVLTSVVWLTSLGVGLFFVLRAFSGQGRGAMSGQGGGRGSGGVAMPVSVVAIALVAAFSALLVSAWRTRVVIDQLGITRRGLLRSQHVPSERIERISLESQRGSKYCVVESLGHKLRLSLELREPATETKLPGALLQMMPDKLSADLRKLATAGQRIKPASA